jgi:hypothetical protein
MAKAYDHDAAHKAAGRQAIVGMAKQTMLNLMDEQRLALDAYNAVVDATESLEEQNVGADLAYLMGAILGDTSCEWPKGRPIMRILRTAFPSKRHAIWKHAKEDK